MASHAAQERHFVHPEAAHAMKKSVHQETLFWFCWAASDLHLCGKSMQTDIFARPPSMFIIEPIYALGIFFLANLFSALYNPIQDCDETFNFWEPTHYLSHGYGLQTWEWSPEYGIRDWLYVLPHAILSLLRRISPQSTKACKLMRQPRLSQY